MRTVPDSTAPSRRERSARDPVVQRAIANVRANIGALPASEVVQLAMWPQTLAAWGRANGEDESQLSNLFRRYRTYARLREALARRLDVPVAVLAHLIDARSALPHPYRRGSPGELALHDATADDVVPDEPNEPAAASPDEAPRYAAPATADRPLVLPPVRDGSNPIEQAALDRLTLDCPAMPASRIVGLALWPESLTAWATRTAHTGPAQLMTALSGLRRAPRAEIELARRLAVSARAMDEFIMSVKAPSRLLRPPLDVVHDSPRDFDDAEAAPPRSATRPPVQGELGI